ncbi:UPF0149 family protein [Haliea sp. E17]|uniref:UPF0149 family protein n=1 Tax=Haliea sp. E17 TaxID=3401576 RepID=UPI003AAD2144
MIELTDYSETPFDFDEVAGYLLEQGIDASPSGIHGCLCGLLAAGAPAEPEAGLALLGQAMSFDLYGELAGLVMGLYEVSSAALEDEEFDFHPLLPDDEAEIGERTGALADWVRGFINGFAQVNQAELRKDSGEILGDFAAIAEACVGEADDDDEAEDSYHELVEYLRFGALNIYMDSRVSAPASNGKPSLH